MTDLIPTPIAPPPHRTRWTTLFASFAVLAVTAGAVVSLALVSFLAQSESNSTGVIQAQAQSISDLAGTVDDLREQLQDNGIAPVGPTVEEIIESLPEVEGVAGPRGFPGDTGPTGAPGADGTSTNGTDGTNGADGADGANGVDGKDGQPPVTWTWTGSTGRVHTCTRTTPFDATAPTYLCN